jgi:hypothetical protein
MDTQPSTRLADLALAAPVAAHESVYVVGFTPEGAIPLIETPSDGRTVICLPGVQLPRAGGAPEDAIAAMRASLVAETGCDASEWVIMSRYGIPTGHRGMATILMAPSLKRAPASDRVRALRHRVHEVAVAEANRWLADRKREGADVDPKVWVGLLLAERHFPRGARARLCAAIARIRADVGVL